MKGLSEQVRKILKDESKPDAERTREVLQLLADSQDPDTKYLTPADVIADSSLALGERARRTHAMILAREKKE